MGRCARLRTAPARRTACGNPPHPRPRSARTGRRAACAVGRVEGASAHPRAECLGDARRARPGPDRRGQVEQALGQRVARSRIGHYESRGLPTPAGWRDPARPAGTRRTRTTTTTTRPPPANRVPCIPRTAAHCRGHTLHRRAVERLDRKCRKIDVRQAAHVHRRHHRPGLRVPALAEGRDAAVRAEMVLQAMTVEGVGAHVRLGVRSTSASRG